MVQKGKRPGLVLQLAALCALCLCLAHPAAAADLRTTSANGYGRLVFTSTHPLASQADGVLVLRFKAKPDFSAKTIVHDLPGYISAGRTDPDGKTFRLALAQPIWLHSSSSGDQFALDLVPASYGGTPPSLPPPAPPPAAKPIDIAALPVLRIRAGAYAHFTRLVFECQRHIAYTIFPGAGRITVRFDARLRPDFKGLEAVAPPWVKEAGWHIDHGATVIDFNTVSQSGYHDFRDGQNVVMDILAPRVDAQSYNPPGTQVASAQQDVRRMRPDLSNSVAASAVQRAAILKAAAAVDGKNPAPPALPVPLPRPAPAEVVAGGPAPVPVTVDADRATLRFPANTAIAAFLRGRNAWIVLSAAQPMDVTSLKAALGAFPSAVAISNQGNVSIVRMTLRSAEKMRVEQDRNVNIVQLAPEFSHNAPSVPITIGRDTDTPDVAALRVPLPGARSAVSLTDPEAGDTLIVVPAAPGPVLESRRRYVDFNALPSAAGLVVDPFVEDLDVRAAGDHVRISRPAGLHLTAATIPAVSNPSALAAVPDGATYLDFADWAHPMHLGLLATERALRRAAAALPASQANGARRQEAQFYIANRFDAEALGVVSQMQSSDPALQGDPELQTIKAAADVMMGRDRDALAALPETVFQNDPHAALWRGLAQAGLQQWPKARESLMRALTVIHRYPPLWRARVRIAYADAAAATGALTAAGDALAHLSKKLPSPLFLKAELARARLDVAQGRYRDAAPLFAALKNCNQPQVAAHAIYDDTLAALAAGAIDQNQAIRNLEQLRYRWRGDALELQTLRKLGALYFAQKRWRKGLGVLRVAVDSFPHDESTRHVQDDMRKAFVALFLGGKADKMPPIQALGLFYDYIDLTPIGSDGDEMIRRMAKRLVNIDLLGPAEQLLKYQVDKRLNGVAQAQVAARLAMIYLMDHKARHALAVLRATRVAGMPDAITHARLLLEARALAALKQYDQAIDLIGVDNARDTQRLRADIYWESGKWPMAGQAAETLLADSWSQAGPLDLEQRHYVMRAAIAYSLAGDDTSLSRLRQHFATKMAASPDAAAFAVVTQDVATQGVAFRDIAAKVASIDTLESFMKDFKKRFDAIPAIAHPAVN